MNTISLDVSKRRNSKQDCHMQETDREFRQMIASIKCALAKDELSQLQATVCDLQENPELIPELVSKLNAAAEHLSLWFRWIPKSRHQSGRLVIRNKNIGLVIDSRTQSSSVDVVVPDCVQRQPAVAVDPDAALSMLSAHTREHMQGRSSRSPARRRLAIV